MDLSDESSLLFKFLCCTSSVYKQNIEAKTHNGIRTRFLQEFIKTEIISKQYGDLYIDLFAWREEVDYNDFADISSEKVLPQIEKVEQFIAIVKQLL